LPTCGAPTVKLASVQTQPTELAKSQERKVKPATLMVLSMTAIKPVLKDYTAMVYPELVSSTPQPEPLALVTTFPTLHLEISAKWV
jgi:hypothetical protein